MSNPQTKKKIRAFVQITTAVLLLSIALIASEVFKELESRSWDWRLRFVAHFVKPLPSVIVITIDQKSVEHMADEQDTYWPWQRSWYVPIIEFLKRAQAKGVAFDILFTEQSIYGVNDDLDFANALNSEMPVVVATASRSRARPAEGERFELFQRKQLELDAKSNFVSRFGISESREPGVWTLPILDLIKSATAIADVNISNDSDGIFRHARIGRIIQDTPVLTLPFALYEAVHPGATPDLSAQRDGKLAVKFAGPSHTYKTYSFAAVLQSFARLEEGSEPLIPLSTFKDAYVFVGMDAPGLQDLRPTPLAPNFPGVEFHATTFDNLLQNSFVSVAPFSVNLLFAFWAGAIGAAGVLFNTRTVAQLTYAVLALLLVVLVCYEAAYLGWWLEMFVPLGATALAIVLAAATQYQLEGSQVRFIKRAFKYYVSPEVIEQIIVEPSQLSLGGQKRELSLFFCDIAGFTGISEKMDAARLGQFLNQFLSEMTAMILQNGGTVDKYVGDAIVAFWNAPLPSPNHALSAVRAAVACQERLHVLRSRFHRDFGQDVFLRIGLHTGFVSVGNFGSADRFNYTVIGDAANLASRLEGANKAFGTDILLSEDTMRQLKGECPCVKIATLIVVGRSEPLNVYTPASRLGTEATTIELAIQEFEKGNFDQSKKLWEEVHSFSALRRSFLDRISEERDQSTLEGWSAVWRLSEK